MKKIIWEIGSHDGGSEFLDNYREPATIGDVVWNQGQPEQKWPLFHPSEADPEGGYRLYPYKINFNLSEEISTDYMLQLDYLIITPRLPYLDISINGFQGKAYLKPEPSESGEIKLHAGLHTSIYSESSLEVVIPGHYLKKGENTLTLLCRDKGEAIHFDNPAVIDRLDRMANGAGLIYQYISFYQLPQKEKEALRNFEVKSTVIFKEDENGNLLEMCHLYFEFNRMVENIELKLRLDMENYSGEEILIPGIEFGHYSQEIYLPLNKKTINYTLEGKIDDRDIYITGQVQPRRKWKVYITPHAHTDIGYTHRQWEIAERLSGNIDKSLDLLEAGDCDLTYHLDASWVLDNYQKSRDAGKIEELNKWIKKGKISVAANYGIPLTQFSGLEDMIRNLEFSTNYLDSIEASTDFASIVDVASLSSSFPYILDKSNIKYLIHANNQDRGPFRLNGGLHKKSPYYWEGLTGGRIMVWLSKMYCELRKVCGSPPVLDSANKGLELWLDEYEREDYLPDAVLLYGQEADNTDLDPQPLDFVHKWNKEYAYPQLIPSNISDFFHYIEDNYGDKLDTVKGDGGAYWEDGIASTLDAAMKVREAQAMLPAAERMASLAVLHGENRKYPLEEFQSAWKEILLFDEHTWGAFLSYTDPDSALQEDQWGVKRQMAVKAWQQSKGLLHKAVTVHSLNLSTAGREVVVYNPHSWTFSGRVEVEIAKDEGIFDKETGIEMPLRIVKEMNTQVIVEFWAEQIPGLSYRRYVLKNNDKQPQSVFNKTKKIREEVKTDKNSVDNIDLENQFYSLSIDINNGEIVSLYDKEINKELVSEDDKCGLGRFLYVEGGEETRLVSNRNNLPEGEPEIRAEFHLSKYSLNKYSYGQILKLVGKVPLGELTVEINLPDKKKKVDINYSYKKEETIKKEAVYIAFPFNLPESRVMSDSHLGWVEWSKDQLPGACKEWLPLQSGILLENDKASIHLSSPDIFLFSVGEIVKGRWPKEMDLSGDKIYSYVLNNYWSTNYKAAQGGVLSFRYSLSSGGNISKEKAYKRGWEERLPLYAHRISLQDFRHPLPPYLGNEDNFLKINNEKVAITTIKKANNSDAYIIRLQELAGEKQEVELSFSGKEICNAVLTDLVERDLDELSVQNNVITIYIGAEELRTLKVELNV